MSSQSDFPDIQMDVNALYREEVFTDRRIGTIQLLTPVKADGSDDDTREVLFMGQTQVMTPMGALPLSFELEADSLSTAVEAFPAAARAALEDAMQELQEMRREQASRIVTPGQSGFGGMGGGPGGGPGGMGGPGGGLKLK